MPEMIGELYQQSATQITYRDNGYRVIPDLNSIDVANGSRHHYTDTISSYTDRLEEITGLLTERYVCIQLPSKEVEVLQSFEAVKKTCSEVDKEYQETVTKRLKATTGNKEHRVPAVDPRMVYAGYVSLRAGGAVVLPTAVGNIIASASPRGLSTMFALKERPPEKAGVVLTTIDALPGLANIHRGWEGYLKHMHIEGILTGSKLPRNERHHLFRRQPAWSRSNSMNLDGTSMFVTLPGPYSDATARVLAKDGHLLTASSANKSGKGNTRNFEELHSDIKRGCDFAVWDTEAIDAYPLDEANESQGVMVDFLPECGESKLHIIRLGFMNGPFITQTAAYLRQHPELGVEQIIIDMHNQSGAKNR